MCRFNRTSWSNNVIVSAPTRECSARTFTSKGRGPTHAGFPYAGEGAAGRHPMCRLLLRLQHPQARLPTVAHPLARPPNPPTPPPPTDPAMRCSAARLARIFNGWSWWWWWWECSPPPLRVTGCHFARSSARRFGKISMAANLLLGYLAATFNLAITMPVEVPRLPPREREEEEEIPAAPPLARGGAACCHGGRSLSFPCLPSWGELVSHSGFPPPPLSYGRWGLSRLLTAIVPPPNPPSPRWPTRA
jgi:hypothetical protein